MFNIRKIFKEKKLFLIARSVQVAILLTIIILAFFILERDLITHMDFVSFYTAANIIKNKTGNLLYDISTQQLFQGNYFDTSVYLVPFRNLPLLALFFIPLTFLPLLSAYKVFVIVNIGLLIFSAKLLSRYFKSFDGRITNVFVFLFFPALIAVLVGQISLLILILWIFIFQALKNKKAFILGILTALLLNKLQFLVFFPFVFLLTSDKRRFLSGFFFSALVILVISTAIVGWQGIIAYPQFLRETETAHYGTEIMSQITLFSAIHYFAYIFKINFLNNVAVFATNFFLFLIPLAFFIKNYRKMSLETNFSVATFLTLAFMIHAWEYALVIILVPVFCLLKAIYREKNKQINRIRSLLILFLFLMWTFRFWAAPFWVGITLFVLGSILLIYPKKITVI